MEDHLLLSQLDCPHHLVGGEIEVLYNRTTRGTFLTLVAEKDILTAFLANVFGQISA
jgi:hypothetical protein